MVQQVMVKQENEQVEVELLSALKYLVGNYCGATLGHWVRKMAWMTWYSYDDHLLNNCNFCSREKDRTWRSISVGDTRLYISMARCGEVGQRDLKSEKEIKRERERGRTSERRKKRSNSSGRKLKSK